MAPTSSWGSQSCQPHSHQLLFFSSMYSDVSIMSRLSTLREGLEPTAPSQGPHHLITSGTAPQGSLPLEPSSITRPPPTQSCQARASEPS